MQMANRGAAVAEQRRSSSLTELLYSLCSLYANNKEQGACIALWEGGGRLHFYIEHTKKMFYSVDGVSHLYRHSLSVLGWYVHTNLQLCIV